MCTLRLLAVIAGIAGLARAQVTLTFSGTPTASSNGYVAGQIYTLMITLDPDVQTFENPFSQWAGRTAADLPERGLPLFKSIGGTMVSGSYTLPLSTSYEYEYDTSTTSIGALRLEEGWTNLAIQALGNAESLRTADGTKAIDLTEMYLHVPYVFAYTRPVDQTANDYFSAYEGTYAIGSGSYFALRNVGEGTLYQEFVISTLVIANATSAVPEPSTYALIIGFVVVAWAGLRRRWSTTRLGKPGI